MGVDGGSEEWVQVVQTLRRQSERKVREEITQDLKERLHHLRGVAARAEAEWTAWTPPSPRSLVHDSHLAGRIDEVAHCLWIAHGSPYRGSTTNHVDWVEGPGHRVEVVTVPESLGCRFTAECRSCGRKLQVWSPTIMGAKRLARRHAGLM